MFACLEKVQWVLLFKLVQRNTTREKISAEVLVSTKIILRKNSQPSTTYTLVHFFLYHLILSLTSLINSTSSSCRKRQTSYGRRKPTHSTSTKKTALNTFILLISGNVFYKTESLGNGRQKGAWYVESFICVLKFFSTEELHIHLHCSILVYPTKINSQENKEQCFN